MDFKVVPLESLPMFRPPPKYKQALSQLTDKTAIVVPQNGVPRESVRATFHNYAREMKMKIRTKTSTKGDLVVWLKS